MTHPHMTMTAKAKLSNALLGFEDLISELENKEMNEDAASIIFHLTTILRHEIELISVEEN